MARAPPEEGRGLALLPLQHGDPRLLGGPRRLRCAPREDEDAANPMDRDDRALGPKTGGPLTRRGPTSHRRNRGWTAAGRARTGDFEIFSLALSQTELPRREASERPAKEIVFGRASTDRFREASP